jgi:hypothetical protein
MQWGWHARGPAPAQPSAYAKGPARVMPGGLTMRLLIRTELDEPLREGHEEAANALDRQAEASAA